MKAVARLIFTYFTGTALLRWITPFGLLAGIGGSLLLLYLPPLTGGSGNPTRLSLAQENIIFLLPVAGILCFTFGAVLLPTLFARLASSHYLYVLPFGRAKVLASALAAIALIALFVAGIITAYYYATPLALQPIFERSIAVSLATVSLLYIVVWLISKSGTIGLLVGSFVIIAALIVPLRFIMLPRTSLAVPWIIFALLWATLATAFLLAPRLKGPFGRLRHALVGLTGSSYRGGGEIDFMIGTARPWILAAGQAVPIALATGLMTAFAFTAPAWMAFLTLLSVTSGAVATFAATRSRSLWLRTRWTRATLFSEVEGSFWRHHCYTLGVLLLLLVGIGTVLGLPTRALAFGMGLVALGSALSTYIGLIVTARIGWGDAALATVAMVALMLTAVYASIPATPTPRIVAYELGLVALAFAIRELARRRWSRLDWMLCRPELGVRASA
jgi:hypothetical protein